MGRHKMAPVLSPGKTWEGAVGAIFFTCLGAWLSWHFLLPYHERCRLRAGLGLVMDSIRNFSRDSRYFWRSGRIAT